jgi:hypothetical protein
MHSAGDAVEIFGLVGAAQHNGKQGVVLRFIPSKGRYAVNVQSTTGPEPALVINVKPANLRAVADTSCEASAAAAEARVSATQRASKLSGHATTLPLATAAAASTASAATASEAHVDYRSCTVQETTFMDPDSRSNTGASNDVPWYHSKAPCGFCNDGYGEHEIHLCCSALQYTGRKEWHRGELQLITWRMDAEFIDPEFDDDFEWGGPESMGWGGSMLEEEAQIKEKFTSPEKCNRDLKKFLREWPNAFRWTCCGATGDSVCGCDHHRLGCSCDYCRGGRGGFGSLGVGMGRAAMGMPPATGTDGAPYKRSQSNRFLKLHGSPETEWELSEGVPWTTSAHVHLPASFRLQARTLLLCWQRLPILSGADSSVALMVLHFLWEAERQQAKTACWSCGRGEACSGSKHSKCGKCKQSFYCSAACQKAHWPAHKLSCRRRGKVG